MTSKVVEPTDLRGKYGDEIGNELYFLIRVVKQDEKSIGSIFEALDALGNAQRQKELIQVIWQQYYQKIASAVI